MCRSTRRWSALASGCATPRARSPASWPRRSWGAPHERARGASGGGRPAPLAGPQLRHLRRGYRARRARSRGRVLPRPYGAPARGAAGGGSGPRRGGGAARRDRAGRREPAGAARPAPGGPEGHRGAAVRGAPHARACGRGAYSHRCPPAGRARVRPGPGGAAFRGDRGGGAAGYGARPPGDPARGSAAVRARVRRRRRSAGVTGRLAKRYARALLTLAREVGALEAMGEELNRAAATFDEPRLGPVVLSPAIDARARLRTATGVADALGLSPMVRNLIGLLAERDRLAILPDLARWFEALLDDELGRVRIAIRSATPLSAGERTELIELARRLTGRRDILAATNLDPELLGGVVLDIGGTVYDGSLRTQLARLTKEMAVGGG
ncbi:MAG: ATP synthase F1 subunit delta [Deltaproteobacteria bacterium]|nr:MAG: ATP synthase F1 subunit delta [Deltaproteobacteria bacterium]